MAGIRPVQWWHSSGILLQHTVGTTLNTATVNVTKEHQQPVITYQSGTVRRWFTLGMHGHAPTGRWFTLPKGNSRTLRSEQPATIKASTTATAIPSKDGWDYITVDAGAATHVCPKGYLLQFPLEEGGASTPQLYTVTGWPHRGLQQDVMANTQRFLLRMWREVSRLVSDETTSSRIHLEFGIRQTFTLYIDMTSMQDYYSFRIFSTWKLEAEQQHFDHYCMTF